MAHNYVNTASRASLDGTLNSNASTFSVASFTGYPSSPFYILMDRDTSAAELMEVTGVAGSTLTVTRGAGGTAATSHSNGATIEHVIPAAVPQSVEQHVEATQNIHGVTGSLIGTDSTGTLANKTFRGAHTHVYSDTLPDAPAGGFVVTADNSLGRDGFIANNTGANADRAAYALRQSGSDRFLVYYDGTIKVNPSGAASRPSIESSGNIKAENFESTDDITAAGDITATGNVEGAAGNFGNLNVSGTLSSTGNNTVGTVTAAGKIQANASGTGLTVVNAAELGSLNVTNGNATLSGTNARIKFPASPAYGTGAATGEVRYRLGGVEAWDGSKWRASYLSASTNRLVASGTVSSSPQTINTQPINGDTLTPYRIQVMAQCELNNVADGTRWDIVVRLDDATSGFVIATGLGNGFTQTGVGWTDVLTGNHTLYYTLVRTLGSANATLTAFNQMFTYGAFGTVD
jgi:hypothetical protein